MSERFGTPRDTQQDIDIPTPREESPNPMKSPDSKTLYSFYDTQDEQRTVADQLEDVQAAYGAISRGENIDTIDDARTRTRLDLINEQAKLPVGVSPDELKARAYAFRTGDTRELEDIKAFEMRKQRDRNIQLKQARVNVVSAFHDSLDANMKALKARELQGLTSAFHVEQGEIKAKKDSVQSAGIESAYQFGAFDNIPVDFFNELVEESGLSRQEVFDSLDAGYTSQVIDVAQDLLENYEVDSNVVQNYVGQKNFKALADLRVRLEKERRAKTGSGLRFTAPTPTGDYILVEDGVPVLNKTVLGEQLTEDREIYAEGRRVSTEVFGEDTTLNNIYKGYIGTHASVQHLVADKIQEFTTFYNTKKDEIIALSQGTSPTLNSEQYGNVLNYMAGELNITPEAVQSNALRSIGGYKVIQDIIAKYPLLANFLTTERVIDPKIELTKDQLGQNVEPEKARQVTGLVRTFGQEYKYYSDFLAVLNNRYITDPELGGEVTEPQRQRGNFFQNLRRRFSGSRPGLR